MNNQTRLIKLAVVLALILSLWRPTLTIAQTQETTPQGLGVAKFIKPTEQVQMTFHRAILKDGKPQQADANTYVVGSALTDTEIEAGFKTGDVVVIRVKSPFAYYIYIVNASEWDGTTLQYPTDASENVENARNQIKDFAFALEDPTNNPTSGREELLAMITKSKIDSPQLTDIIGKQGKIEITPVQIEVAKKELQSAVAPSTEGTQTKTPSSSQNKTKIWVKALSIGCNVSSIFFPFARLICGAIPGSGGSGGFGIAKYIQKGNTTAVAPASDTERLTFRLSFPVTPRS